MIIELFSNLEFGGIDWNDYPDFSDVYVESGDYDGMPMDGDQLDELNHDTQMVYELYEKFSN
jgi:hypothetical protein